MHSHIKRYTILFAVALAALLINLDMSVVNLALPTIGLKLHIPLSMLQWIVVIYLISASVAFIIGGRITDQYGGRIVGGIGMGLFLLGSIIAGFALDGWLIALGRAVQGLGFGLTVPAMIFIACNQFAPDKKTYAIGMIVVAAGIVQCVGPTIGGILIHWLNWRWIFLINIPICLVYLLLTLTLCNKHEPEEQHHKLTYGGITLYFLFGFFLIYSTEILETHPADWFYFLIALALCLMFLYFSYRIERKKAVPTIPYFLLRNHRYRNIIMIRCLSQIPFFAYLFFIPFMYHAVYGMSAYTSGLHILFLSGGFGLFALFSAQLVNALGFIRCLIISCILTVISTAIILFLTDTQHLLWIHIALFFAGVSTAFVITPTVSQALDAVPPKDMGQATGLLYSISVGVSVPINVAITAVIMTFSLMGYLFHGMEASTTLNANQHNVLSLTSSGVLHPHLLKHYFSPDQISLLKKLFNQGMHLAFQLIAIFCALTSIGSVIILLRTPKKAVTTDPTHET